MDKWNEVSMVPKWLRVSGIVLRIILTFVPFLIGLEVMIWGVPGGNGHLELIWMAIWFLSLLQIINLVDYKIK